MILECSCPDPRGALGEDADVRYPIEFDPACLLHSPPPAPALTAEEAAIVAVFEAAPYPAEVLLSHLESVRAALASPAPAPQGEERPWWWLR